MKARITMKFHYLVMFNCYILCVFLHNSGSARAYSLTPSQSITDGEALVSRGGTFKLGFFSPSNSTNRYLAIWYNNIPVQTVVWVANRDSPLHDTSGILKIDTSGNIVIVDSKETVIWSSNSSSVVAENPLIEFLESGNLVLRDVKNQVLNSYVWQSFDYPSDTLLPGMKLGWDLRIGMDRYLTSWKSSDDPSSGNFSYGIDRTRYIEPVISEGSVTNYRAGPWNGVRSSGAPDVRPNSIFTYEVISNADEMYFMYQLVNQSFIMRIVLTQTSAGGQVRRYTWADKANSWVLLLTVPRDRCDDYALCGIYSTCDTAGVAVCECLKGFKPKSPEDWSGTDWSQGCERETPLTCTRGEGFVKFSGLKPPDTRGSLVDETVDFEECRVKCLNNCSCTAYGNLDIREGKKGCIMWFTDLIDMRQVKNAGQDIYIRMAASELVQSTTKKHTILIACITAVAGVILMVSGIWLYLKKKTAPGNSEGDDLESHLYSLATISRATNKFSEKNKLGEGGFGPVYMGELKGGQLIAVKRLSKDSMQGDNEFKNEILLISKLQHRNLARLLGCCIEGHEKMLVYDYMENKSLDSFIFDETKRGLLDWPKRFQIILGIARGILYLHYDSRLRIIHRDLKASNILLDSEMVPKISDFGMARIFGGDQIETKTKRVAGTYGYMSPEYAIDGLFSVKSDVFSFGVLILEAISGKKNSSFSHSEHEFNLLGHAWRLWTKNKSIDLVEESIKDSSSLDDILRCIHIGLLCVQSSAVQRPTMSSVVLMLSNETSVLPRPQLPGFYIERSTSMAESSAYSDSDFCTSNDVTITILQAR